MVGNLRPEETEAETTYIYYLLCLCCFSFLVFMGFFVYVYGNVQGIDLESVCHSMPLFCYWLIQMVIKNDREIIFLHDIIEYEGLLF